MIIASEGCQSDDYAGVPCMEDELDANEIGTWKNMCGARLSILRRGFTMFRSG